MGAFISRQPNGRLCRFSTVVDCITHYNMTEEDYIEMCAERAREEARYIIDHHLVPFERVIQDTRFYNMTKEEFEMIREKMELKEYGPEESETNP